MITIIRKNELGQLGYWRTKHLSPESWGQVTQEQRDNFLAQKDLSLGWFATDNIRWNLMQADGTHHALSLPPPDNWDSIDLGWQKPAMPVGSWFAPSLLKKSKPVDVVYYCRADMPPKPPVKKPRVYKKKAAKEMMDDLVKNL